MNFAPMQLAAFRQMAATDLQGGTASYGGGSYACTVGTFRLVQMLTPGGVSPTLIGDVQIATADFPPGVTTASFRTAQKITITPKLGAVRNCTIEEVVPAGALIHLTLRDVNQGA